jgi:hypothetical protein
MQQLQERCQVRCMWYEIICQDGLGPCTAMRMPGASTRTTSHRQHDARQPALRHQHPVATLPMPTDTPHPGTKQITQAIKIGLLCSQWLWTICVQKPEQLKVGHPLKHPVRHTHAGTGCYTPGHLQKSVRQRAHCKWMPARLYCDKKQWILPHSTRAALAAHAPAPRAYHRRQH